MKRFVFLALSDVFLLIVAFGLVHIINYWNLDISGKSLDLLRLQIFIWLLISLLSRKFIRLPNLSFIMGSILLIKTGIAFLLCVPLVIVALQLMEFSRAMAYGTILVFIFLETVALALYQWIEGPVGHPAQLPQKKISQSVSPVLLVLDGILLVFSFFAVTCFKRGSLELYQPYDEILFILLAVWLGFSILTRKFVRENYDNLIYAMGTALKNVLLMAGTLAFFVYLLRLEPFSRVQILGALPLFLVLESVFMLLYVNYRRYVRTGKGKEKQEPVKGNLDPKADQQLLEPVPLEPVREPASDKIKYALELFDPKIYEFVNKNIDLTQIDWSECKLFSTDNMLNLQALEDNNSGLIFNMHKINDMRWLNRYLLLAHDKLRFDGYLVGRANALSTHYKYIQSMYPGMIGNLLYGAVFVWLRVFPKLPWMQKVYFAITRGKHRVLSRAEILGRLSFCGYKIAAEEEIDYRFYFIARKIKTPSRAENPTYGPLVKLKRTGIYGKPIIVYKFRTMNPFSEYLQPYVFYMNGTKDGDKIVNDFRITSWGKMLRKLWIDELPMLYNWLRGDLKLVGVRPLSAHKLSTYPVELQEKRKKVKPGLLPPFYADRPNTVEGFFQAEKRYLDEFMKRPLITDVRYFWIILWNIVVRKARSG